MWQVAANQKKEHVVQQLNSKPNKFSGVSNKGLESVAGAVQGISNKLKQSVAGSEKDIIAIGSKLQGFLQVSQNIVTHSESTIESISRDILDAGVTELNGLISDFSTTLQKAADGLGSNKDKLFTILDNVHLIVDGFQGFRRIIKQLKMLGISTKIETSRLGNDDKGFNTIADNVDRLAQLIETKVTTLEAKAKAIVGEIEKTTADLLLLEKEQRVQSKMIVDHTLSTLQLFEVKHNEYLTKTDKIKTDSAKIYSSIMRIVTSVQFHDITRQQIEHVVEALQEAEYILHTYETDESGLERMYGQVYDICCLQVEHVNHARDEFYSAVLDIIRQLNEISLAANDILGVAVNLLAEFDNQGNSFGNIETDLLEILNGLMKNSEISWRLLTSTKSVIATIEELTASIQQIEEIGTEIELIALNARVRAAHTGANGASLGVLAESIQKLSVDAKKQTETSTEILAKIGTVSNFLREELDSYSHENSAEQVNKTHNHIKSLLANISQEGVALNKKIAILTGMVKDLQKSIASSTSGISVHLRLKEMLDRAAEEFSEIITIIANNTQISTDKERNTGHLKKKYTMQSERMVHGRYLAASPVSKKSQTQQQAADVDSNIELF